MTSASAKARARPGGAGAVVLSVLAMACYVVMWVGYGLRGGGVQLAPAVMIWLALAGAVSWWWHRRWGRVLVVVGSAAVSTWIWSPVLVDFQADWVDGRPAVVLPLLVAPLLLAVVGGVIVRERAEVSAALIVLLSAAALLPVQISNTSAMVVGGWAGYHPAPAAIVLPCVPAISAAVGAGVLRRWLGRRGARK